MSDQNSPKPDPSEAVPGYTPPTTPEPVAPSEEPPAYTPPAAPGGYEPPAAPPAYTPPSTGGYEPPSAPPPPYTPPSTGGYDAPAPSAYPGPPAGGYSQPPVAGGGYPEPTGFPPPAGYGQQPSYGTGPGAYPGGGNPNLPLAPVGGAPLADWPKRALGGLIDYVAAGVVISVIVAVISAGSDTFGQIVRGLLVLGWGYLYLGYKSGTTGITLGRSIAKTKLISEETGQPIGAGMGILRQFAHIIDGIICGIGWLFPLWDSKKQTIADKLMKTVVIDNSADPNASTYNWQ